MVTVYADVLVALNILITYLFLVCTRMLCRSPTNKVGIAVAAVLGGFSSLVVFCDGMGIGLLIAFKLFTAAILVTVAFFPVKVRLFLKSFVVFFGVSFLFGGIMYAVEITFNPQNILYLNGTVYFDMSLAYLVGSVLVIYGVFLLCNFFLSRYLAEKEIYDVKITFREKSVEVKGFFDTGNNLKEGISGRPVLIADLSAIAPLFDYAELKYFKSGVYDEVPESLQKSVRLIPCTTVTGEAMLKGFIPEQVEYKSKNKRACGNFVAVAVSTTAVSSGEYGIILNSGIDLEGKVHENKYSKKN